MNTNSSQTSDTWLKKATTLLKNAGILTARLDALIILEDATGKDRSWLLAHPEFLLPPAGLSLLEQQIESRQKHEPLAYIRGKSEFYGREFIVTPDTLQPRPETETMIDILKSLYKAQPCTVIDVGTGSGCLAITAKLELPEIKVVATDVSLACIKVGRQNASKLGADIDFYQLDLLLPLPSMPTNLPIVILANLPYVPDSQAINEAARFEPKLAIFGGADGFDLYRRLFDQVRQLKVRPEYILTESLTFQHRELTQIAQNATYSLVQAQDLILCFRIGELAV